MTGPDDRLTEQLVTTAVLATDHPADAVSALLCAAAAMLVRDFGTPATIEMLKASVDEAATAWRRKAVN